MSSGLGRPAPHRFHQIAAGATDVEGLLFYADLSPDGRLLAYSSWREDEGDAEVFLFDLIQGTEVQLTFNDVSDWSVAWAPDGSLAAFERRDTISTSSMLCQRALGTWPCR
jgi:Tol biopolymer transport system component